MLTGCPQKPQPPINTSQFVTEIEFLVNSTRQETFPKQDQPTAILTAESALFDAAQKYAELMAERKQLSHNVDGQTLRMRVNNSGYNRWTTIGENIAMGFKDTDSLFKSWMDSPGHRANILNPKFKDTGIGIAKDNNGTIYYCQIFGAAN